MDKLRGEIDNKDATCVKIETCCVVNASVSGPQGKLLITGCSFMPTGHVVLCDNHNGRILLSDSDLNIKVRMDLHGKPFDVAAVDNRNVIVTLPHEQQLQYVQVLTNFKKGRAINIHKRCYGIAFAGGQIYTSCVRHGKDGEIRVYNADGSLCRRIGVNPDGSYLFKEPYNLAVQKSKTTVTGDFYDIYVSDLQTDIITCLTAEGGIVYQYFDVDLKMPLGLHVDRERRAFVCGWKSDNVQVLTAEGKKCVTLRDSSDGVERPYCIAYRDVDRKLILFCKDKVFIMTLLI